MIIKPPDWATDAQPTMEGWINRETGELLVRAPAPANVFTQQQIDEYEVHWISKKQAEAIKATEIRMKEQQEDLKHNQWGSMGEPQKPKKKKKKTVSRKNK